MSHESDLSPAEDDFAARLAELHEALLDQDAGSLQAPEEPDGDSRLDEVAVVLRLIERVRRREGETPRSRSDPQSTAPDSPAKPTGSDHTSAGNSEPADEPEDELPALPPRIGRFHVVRQLGAGGYGIVLLGYDPLLKRPVAIKVPRPEVLITRDLRDRFTREAEAAAALHHANVVPVYETGNDGPISYIAAAYIHGPSLADWLRQHAGCVAPRQAARILQTLAGAVEHAHQRGVLHRDLKPANILIEEGEKPLPSAGQESAKPDGVSLDPAKLRITDFGLAKLIESTGPRTRTGAIVGTPAYMSPEQAEGGLVDVGPETDIYALGVILYELLVGRPPFAEGGLWETLRAVRQKEPIPPRRLRPGIPRDLEAICLKCLEKPARRRYRSATELAADLDRFLQGDAVRARRPGCLERTARWCRLNPLLASLLAVILVLMAGLTVQSQLSALHLAAEVERKDVAERAAHAMRRRAEYAQRRAQQELFDSLLNQNRMLRATGTSGQRNVALSTLKSAASVARQLDLEAEQKMELRNELIAALGQIDFRQSVDLVLDTDARRSLAYSVDRQLVAVPRSSRGEVLVRHVDETRKSTTIGGFDELSLILRVDFTADGSKLLISYLRRRQGKYLRVWDLDASKSLLDTPADNGSEAGSPLRRASHVDSRGERVAIPIREGAGRWSIRVIDLDERQTESRLRPTLVPSLVRFHPHRNELVVVGNEGLELWDLDNGRRLDRSGKGFRRFPETPRDACWSANGSVLAVVAGDLRLWSRRNLAWSSQWETPTGPPTRVCFSSRGDLLATSSRSEVVSVWSPADGRLLWRGSGELAGFSADGKQLAFASRRGQVGHWKIVRSDSHVVLDHHLQAPRQGPFLLTPFPSRDVSEILTFDEGRLGVCRVGSVVGIWDTQRHRLLGEWERVMSIAGDARGRYLAVETDGNVLIWEIRGDWQGSQRRIRFEGPRRVTLTPHPEYGRKDWKLLPGGTAHEVLLATFDRNSDAVIAQLDCRDGDLHILRDDFPPASVGSAASSSDGELFAVALRSPRELRIYRRNGDELRSMPSDEGGTLQFLPGSKNLVVTRASESTVLNALDGQPCFTFHHEALGRHAPRVAVDPGGQWLAVSRNGRQVGLFDPQRGREMARIELSGKHQITALAVGRAGRKLLVGTQNGPLHLFELGLVQKEARQLGLSWPWETAPPPPPATLTVDLPRLP